MPQNFPTVQMLYDLSRDMSDAAAIINGGDGEVIPTRYGGPKPSIAKAVRDALLAHNVLSIGDVVAHLDTVAGLRNEVANVDGQTYYVAGHSLRGEGAGVFYYDASDVTSADDDGMVIVNTTGQRFKRVLADKAVHLDFYGLTGTEIDFHARLQAIYDMCESNGYALHFNETKRYEFYGTFYVGDAPLYTHGALLSFNLVSTYTVVGTARRATEGVILTKSAMDAGYGRATVTPKIDCLNMTVTKPSTNATTLKTTVIFENTVGLRIGWVYAMVPDAPVRRCPFDLYTGNIDVHIGYLVAYIFTQGEPGGVWIRELEQNTSDRIRIDYVFIETSSLDEGIAVFNHPGNGATTPWLTNVTLGHVHVKQHGPGKGASFLNNTDPNIDLLRGVKIQSLVLDIEFDGLNQFGFQFRNTGGTVDNLIINARVAAGATGALNILNKNGASIAESNIGTATINLLSRDGAATANVTAQRGDLKIGTLTVTSEQGVAYNNAVVNNGRPLMDVHITANTLNNAVRSCREVRGTVRGVINGVDKFDGTHIIPTDDKASYATWFTRSSDIDPPLDAISYRATIVVEGSQPILAVIYLDEALSRDVPVFVEYALSNPSDLEIGKCLIKQSYLITHYNAIEILSGNQVKRRELELDLPYDTAGDAYHTTEFSDINSALNQSPVLKRPRTLYYDKDDLKTLRFCLGVGPTDAWFAIRRDDSYLITPA